MRNRIQKLGSFLSGMIMPNIGAFIAWGLITALFIETGWLPNEKLASLNPILLNYVLPILVAYQGGSRIHGTRGAVIGVVAASGTIAGTDIPMFLGSMIVSPIAAWLLKKLDEYITPKIPKGFEMLINNFTLGILGMLLAIISYWFIGPFVSGLSNIMQVSVQWLIDKGLIWLVSIVAEPAKVLFLNNAIDHGIIGPIALEQVAQVGKSFLFMIIQNPGPGLGILLAYLFFGKDEEKQSAPGAIIIHFLGGIHEIYFPYILANPLLIIPTIISGGVGLLVFNLMDAGMVAAASPGSIFAILAMTERSSYLGIIAGIIISALVSFVLAIPILKLVKTDKSIEDATAESKAMKHPKENHQTQTSSGNSKVLLNDIEKLPTDIKVITFACDAGMGSSAMGAAILREKVEESGLDINVNNSSIFTIPDNADVVITQKELVQTAIENSQNVKGYFTVDNFLSSPTYDDIVNHLKKNFGDNHE